MSGAIGRFASYRGPRPGWEEGNAASCPLQTARGGVGRGWDRDPDAAIDPPAVKGAWVVKAHLRPGDGVRAFGDAGLVVVGVTLPGRLGHRRSPVGPVELFDPEGAILEDHEGPRTDHEGIGEDLSAGLIGAARSAQK
jgi:hypothetical protein